MSDDLRAELLQIAGSISPTPQRLTMAEWHAVWHVTAEVGFDCTGDTDCPARLHGHGCALDPCTKATTDPAPAAADQPMPADEKPILAHTTGWQGVVERAALRCADVDRRNWNLVSEADRDRYRQYGMAMFRALPPHIAGQMSAAPQAPAEPKKQCAWWWDTRQCPDWALPGGKYCNGHQRDHNDLLREVPEAAREDAATPEAAPHDVEVTVQDDGWATAECRTCAAHIGESTEDTVSDWADQHRADTLRPSGPLAPIRHEEE